MSRADTNQQPQVQVPNNTQPVLNNNNQINAGQQVLNNQPVAGNNNSNMSGLNAIAGTVTDMRNDNIQKINQETSNYLHDNIAQIQKSIANYQNNIPQLPVQQLSNGFPVQQVIQQQLPAVATIQQVPVTIPQPIQQVQGVPVISQVNPSTPVVMPNTNNNTITTTPQISSVTGAVVSTTQTPGVVGANINNLQTKNIPNINNQQQTVSISNTQQQDNNKEQFIKVQGCGEKAANVPISQLQQLSQEGKIIVSYSTCPV